jgi:hypothetical protein
MAGDPRLRRGSTQRPSERSPAANSSPPWIVLDESDSSESDSAPSERSSTPSTIAIQDDGTTSSAQASGHQDPEPANIHLLKALIELHVNRIFEQSKEPLVQALTDQIITGKTEQESVLLFIDILRSRAKINLAFHQCHVSVGK